MVEHRANYSGKDFRMLEQRLEALSSDPFAEMQTSAQSDEEGG